MNLKVRIPKSELLDTLILYIMLLQVFIFRWLGLQDIINYVLLILMVLSLLSKYKIIGWRMFFWLSVTALYPLINYFILGGSILNAVRNDYRIMRGLIIIVYGACLWKTKKDLIVRFFHDIFGLVNIYMLINMIVLFLQIRGSYSLAAFYSFSIADKYKPDLISGLFGLYGTPCLAMFTTFFAIYNYAYSRDKTSTYKNILMIYTLVILIVNIWISAAYNDNKGIYIVLPMYIICAYIAINISDFFNNRYKVNRISSLFLGVIIVVAFIGVLVYIIYYFVPEVHNSIDMLIRKIVQGMEYSSVTGGGERFGMILYLISKPSKWVLGFGMGKYTNNSGYLGFEHFGQADIGTFLCLGGFIYIILLFINIFSALRMTYQTTFITNISLIIFLVVGIYTQLFTNTSTTIITVFLIWCLALLEQNISIEKININIFNNK